MKYLKFIMGGITSIFTIIAIMFLANIFVSIFEFVFSLIIVKFLVGFIGFLIMCSIALTFIFCAYYITIELLETHFKFFRKDN